MVQKGLFLPYVTGKTGRMNEGQGEHAVKEGMQGMERNKDKQEQTEEHRDNNRTGE